LFVSKGRVNKKKQYNSNPNAYVPNAPNRPQLPVV